jgi:predicted permease
VYSVVDRVLFRALPYPHADRLLSVGLSAPIEQTEFMIAADYAEWRRAQTPFEAMGSFSGVTDCDLTEPDPLRLTCAMVEATWLPVLGVRPVIGRNFTAQEDRPNMPRVALISYALWKDRYGGEPAVLERAISVDSAAVRIIGVLPAGFEMPTLQKVDQLVPQALPEVAPGPRMQSTIVRVFARLKPGVSIAAAEAALQPLFQQALQHVPAQFRKEVRLRLQPVRERQVAGAKLASWVLLGGVFAVLLIACANVTNLLLARGASRRRELAMRAAIGASRGRLIRQALTESMLLALAGGLAGLALAAGLLRVFVAIAPDAIPRLQQASLDARVFGFTVAVAVGAALLFGLAPAFEDLRWESLSGWRGIGPGKERLRRALVAWQFAASLTLLTAASLLVQTLRSMESSPLGFQPDDVLVSQIILPQHMPPAQRGAFFEQVESRIRSIPGGQSVALSDSLPPAGRMGAMIYSMIELEGRSAGSGDPGAGTQQMGTGGMVAWRAVTVSYFAALDIRVIHGRPFLEEDLRPGQDAIIVSEALAKRLASGSDVLGRRVRTGRAGPWRTVVGIAADVKNGGLTGEPEPEYYVPRQRIAAWNQISPSAPETQRRAFLIVRTSEPDIMSRQIRREIAVLAPTLPVGVESMRQRVARLADRPRFQASLLTLFAALGLGLAAIGLYGVTSFLVARRTQEIGVRMAVGATPAQIRRQVLGEAAKWTVAGAALGLGGSLLVARWLRTLLYQAAGAPASALAATVLLLIVAGLAAWVPARRASRVNPVVAPRQE